ncbi:MAG: 2OG-Fe(II) oxygenase [Gammaproteobacteria bacterium]|nr:MAG: 2OG-Fe(II) oxygenase [Gammaproteobacteria bacterium]
MLNLEAIRTAKVSSNPYPFCVITNSIQEDSLSNVGSFFPTISHPGSIPMESVNYEPIFGQLLAQLEGDEFRQIIEEKFDIDLHEKPTMVTLRGLMRKKDGRIHTDSKTKLITVLLYFNDEWNSSDGQLRVLNNGQDLDNYVAEIPPLLGTMVIFKVTDNCWHGHTPLEGKRLSIQLNYLIGDSAKNKHQFFHKLSAKIKNLFTSNY